MIFRSSPNDPVRSHHLDSSVLESSGQASDPAE
jgi:hypothetical protein